MKLKTAQEHHDDSRPDGGRWPIYSHRHTDGKLQVDLLVQSVREEIADALREAMGCDNQRTIEQLIDYATSLKEETEDWSHRTEWVQDREDWGFPAVGMHRANVMRKRIEMLESAQKPADVAAAETEEERLGRLEYERWRKGSDSYYDWKGIDFEEQSHWIAYAKTVQRQRVSPGQRMREAVEFAAGHCGHDVRDEHWEAAANALGIKECDA